MAATRATRQAASVGAVSVVRPAALLVLADAAGLPVQGPVGLLAVARLVRWGAVDLPVVQADLQGRARADLPEPVPVLLPLADFLVRAGAAVRRVPEQADLPPALLVDLPADLRPALRVAAMTGP
jgi:hypothetical protein